MKITALAAGLLLMAGCTTVDDALLSRAESYHGTIVEGVLLPAYLTHPEVSAEAKANVAAAVSEHGAFLDEVAAGGAE